MKIKILGAFSAMPAVNTFAMYASVSILINFLLQITAFIALLSLDSRRTEVNCYKFSIKIVPFYVREIVSSIIDITNEN